MGEARFRFSIIRNCNGICCNKDNLKYVEHFINELDKIGLQLINVRGTLIGRLVVLLETKNANSMSTNTNT
jgi:hypothetical protein